MDEIARLLTKHPEFASWLMSDDFTPNVDPNDLRNAFKTLRPHSKGKELIRLYRTTPTLLRSAASIASGFSGGHNAARLTGGLRSILPRLAGAGRGVLGGPGALVGGAMLGEGIEALAEDREAGDIVKEYARKRAVASSLDRELRTADRRGGEQRQMLEEARARQAEFRGAGRPSRPLPPLPGAHQYLSGTEEEPRLQGTEASDERILEEIRGRQEIPQPSSPQALIDPTRRADYGVPTEDIVTQVLRSLQQPRAEPETSRQWVKSDRSGTSGSWQDLPYELQPQTTLSEREIMRMIRESR